MSARPEPTVAIVIVSWKGRLYTIAFVRSCLAFEGAAFRILVLLQGVDLRRGGDIPCPTARIATFAAWTGDA